MVQLSRMKVGNKDSIDDCNDNTNNVNSVTAKLIIKTPVIIAYNNWLAEIQVMHGNKLKS
jgi:hypothetical protein